MNLNKYIKGGLVAAGLTLASLSGHAQTATTPDDAVTATVAKVDKVGEYGAKAYLIAGGLALAGVVIAFVKKAKR